MAINFGEPLHPANAEVIAEFAEETGAEVLRGAPTRTNRYAHQREVQAVIFFS